MSAKHYEWKIGEALPELGEHSRAKHEIFERYVGVYIDYLTRIPAQTDFRLTLVDGFCGGGLYDYKGAEADGSPLRLLRAVEQREIAIAASRRKPFKIHADFFFVDANPNHIAFLDHLLRKNGYGSRIGRDIFLQHATFEAACPDIVSFIQNKGTSHRSLFFLDQYGWSDVRLATIRTILGALANPEILLTFAVDALIDFLSPKTAANAALLAIDYDREDVRDLMAMRNEQGWRYLIQNSLYGHLQARTGARFYTPFFIHSPDSHRSYWLLHLSHHRQARDEMGKLHWRIQNHFQHHGGAGFHALGFNPARDLRQDVMDFMFDDDAMRRSESAVLEQIPRLIFDAAQSGRSAVELEALFAARCNDTPVTSDILKRQLIQLRDQREVAILGPDGKPRPRAVNLAWTDRIVLPPQKSFFGPFGVLPT